jgi:Zn finger protein HypA/HybF involved in hydrogenase expression
MGISTKSGNFQTLDKYCKKFSIDTTHFSNTHKFSNGGFTRKISNDDMFCEHSSASRNNVKKRIIKYKLLPYKCVKCINEGKWNGEKLVLQLEHQNGINDDNRLENLCFLCPNCHSQTKTFGSRNRKTKIIV